jgi:folate-binding protein YgfZ
VTTTARPDAAARAYEALTTGVVSFDRSDRARVKVSGPDRVRFLHNLTTNDVKRLAARRGQEAFVTSLQGKTLGYVLLLADDDRILLRTDPGALAPLWPHLQKYGVFDDVTLADLGAETFEIHLAGPRAGDLLGRLDWPAPDPDDLAHCVARLPDGAALRIVREAPTGRPGLTVIGPAGSAGLVSDRIRSAAESAGPGIGLVAGDAATFETARIEAGTPRAGQDVTPENLPQELGRDARAISFIKGCYLGQETVARIDALGHVNKHLKGLVFPRGGGIVPSPGAAIEAGGKAVGTITSAADSPGWHHPVALGYVRAANAAAGSEVHVVVDGTRIAAVVADLPMLPPGSAG